MLKKQRTIIRIFLIVNLIAGFFSQQLTAKKNSITCCKKNKINIRPFRAYRPHPDLFDKIVCPSHNSLNIEEAYELARRNPYSCLHIIRPEVDLYNKKNPYEHLTNNTFGLTGKENLCSFIKNNWLIQDQQKSFYIYGQRKHNSTIYGLLVEISINNYHDRLIKAHENILPKKEKALTDFINLENAHVDPVVLTYKASQNINNLIEKLTYKKPIQLYIDKNKVEHMIWPISNPNTVTQLRNFFSKIPTMYITDGHHRSAASYQVCVKRRLENQKKGLIYKGDEPYNFYMAALFPDKYVNIIAYNRIIKELNGLKTKEFLTALNKTFDIHKINKTQEVNPTKQHIIAMFLDDNWYHLKIKKHVIGLSSNNQEKSLDLSIVKENIFKNILGITSLNDSYNIKSVSGLLGPAELESKCKKTGWKLGFAFHPVSIQQFMNIVDDNKLMPAKTTWFEPKILPGLIVRTPVF